MIFWVIAIISFMGTSYAMPHSIRKLKDNGYLAQDMYKIGKPEIPTNAGIIILFTSFITISLIPLLSRIINEFFPIEEDISDLSKTNLAFLLVVSIYALYGLVDDLVDVGRKLKIILPVIFGYPLISVIYPESIWLPLLGESSLNQNIYSDIKRSDMFRILVIPVYVMVVSNLVNMHSGYNGLQSGLSLILLLTLVFKSILDDKINSIMPAGAFLGAIFSFWIHNKYPSRVFEGNIGSLLFGSLLGSIIVIQEYWWFGFFILIPHTFNFLLWNWWLVLMKKNPELHINDNGEHTKFGFVNEDNILVVPNYLTLKWIPNYFIDTTERQSTIFCYFLTGIFCITGLLIF